MALETRSYAVTEQRERTTPTKRLFSVLLGQPPGVRVHLRHDHQHVVP
jgi:hypothetical protein